MSVLLLFIAVLFILLFGGLIWSAVKRGLSIGLVLLANAVMGLIAIFLLNFLGFGIPVNTITLIVSAVFGLAGVAVLALLALFGMI